MFRRVLALLALALVPVTARAQVARPVHHGCLYVRFAGGPFDRASGEAMLRVPGWRFTRAADSNGLSPDREQLVIALGENEYTLDAGALHASRSGKSFSYHAAKGTPPPAIKRLRVKLRKDGTYATRFTLSGLALEQLINADGLCLPMALIIGDDDFFSGVRLIRLGSLARSKRFAIASSCTPSSWPMLGGTPPVDCPPL